eukprot:TRINITY_DN24619_c0_g2_i2.p1 TRINITY_DN24619_c0_g2~~TRINITY_DN24619_c0_g2_i2.p1  ORF type:complete len:401 (+),score=61.07 TRINITY_DN24619_c0_g2_i2:88-1290(+)
MAPTDDDVGIGEQLISAFSCGLCKKLLFEPTSLSCCGSSFCRRCLRRWIESSVHDVGVPRCPSGGDCNCKLPVRLPGKSHALIAAMEQMMPDRYEDRKRQLAEEENAAASEQLERIGGFMPWQEVAAVTDIIFNNKVGVRRGTHGILIGDTADGRHLTVRFDGREDRSELCVNVLPEALMDPLPGSFRLGQQVMALHDLVLDGRVGVKLGTKGTVMGRCSADRVTVLFQKLEDSLQGALGVHVKEISTVRPLVGGYQLAQHVQPVRDLVVSGRVVAKMGSRGIVVGEYSEARLTVAFDGSSSDTHQLFNVLPLEVQPWCEPPAEFPPGCDICASTDLMNAAGNVVIEAGTHGSILSGVSATKVFVVFSKEASNVSPSLPLMVEAVKDRWAHISAWRRNRG